VVDSDADAAGLEAVDPSSLELLERESTASTQATVVPDRGAAHSRTKAVNGPVGGKKKTECRSTPKKKNLRFV
jgi:hypothetical protein